MKKEHNGIDQPIETAEERSAAMPIRLIMRNYFSSHLLWAARHFASKASEIEGHHSGRARFDIEHRAYVITAVMSAVGFLEAMVNELFQDAADDHGTTGDGYIAPLTPRTRELMRAYWEASEEGAAGVLTKYQLLLVFAEVPRLDGGAQPYQNVVLLIKLRNALVHFKPESVAADVANRFTNSLQGKFPDNVLMGGSGNPWWPDHALGAGCADWAVKSAKALTDSVNSAIGIVSNYQRLEATW